MELDKMNDIIANNNVTPTEDEIANKRPSPQTTNIGSNATALKRERIKYVEDHELSRYVEEGNPHHLDDTNDNDIDRLNDAIQEAKDSREDEEFESGIEDMYGEYELRRSYATNS